MKNPRTSRLEAYLPSGVNIRLSEEDRLFLMDLAKIQVCPAALAQEHHYKTRTSAERRLSKLSKAGLLKQHFHYGVSGKQAVFEFANDGLAKAFGGSRVAFGANRSLNHEIVTTQLYFALGRPETFIKEDQFTKHDKSFIKEHMGGDKSHTPDALMIDENGEYVFVEADSGQYTKVQITSKQWAWRGIKQVWGQPSRAFAPLREGANIDIYKF